MTRWSPQKFPGKETAVKLASLGADTIILCRDALRAETAVAEIKQKSRSTKVRWECICSNFYPSLRCFWRFFFKQNNSALSIDLTSLESIRKCAATLVESTEKIDALINNAGVMAIPKREITTDGFEKQMGINHFGHYALTGLLFEHLKKSENSRIVNVASSAHTFGNIDRNDLMLEKSGAYQAWKAYGNSKLANILFTKELTKKLYLRSDSNIAVVCCHPGKATYLSPSRHIFSLCLSINGILTLTN